MVVRSGFDDFEAIQLPVGERELTRVSPQLSKRFQPFGSTMVILISWSRVDLARVQIRERFAFKDGAVLGQ